MNNQLIRASLRIFIIDTNIVALGLRTLLGGMLKRCEVVSAVTSYAVAYDQIGKMQSLPDLVIADICLGNGVELESIKQLVALYPSLRILVFSMEREQIFAVRCLKAGAIGFVSKTAKYDYLTRQIESALQGNCVLSEHINSYIAQRFVGKPGANVTDDPIQALTDREVEILRLIGEMKGTRQIAEKLHLSVKTIDTHQAHIKKKLGLGNAVELHGFAYSFVQSGL